MSGDAQGSGFATTRDLGTRYRVSERTIFEWCRQPELGFPEPVLIRGRKYWRLAELEAWERSRLNTGERGRA